MDPKADLTFKKVFGEHKDLVISFLNALLPFESEEDEISEVIEYMDPELRPRNPLKRTVWWISAAVMPEAGSSWLRCR